MKNLKVNKYTRAGKEGKLIMCPHCQEAANVYHFSWSAITCKWCKKSVNKYEWNLTNIIQ